MKRLVLSLFTFILITFPLKINAEGNRFEDVLEDSFYFQAVNFLYNEGIVKGREKGFFEPEMNISRVEALKIVYDLKGIILQRSLPHNNIFPDIENHTWYAPYVFMANLKQTMQGVENGNFEPDRNITRAESCKIILSTYSLRLNQIHKSFSLLHEFQDIDESDWYSPCAGYAYHYGLFSFDGDNFEPDKFITRGEFSYFVYNVNDFYHSGDLRKNREEIEEEKNEYENDIDFISEEYLEKWNLLKTGVSSYYADDFNGRNTASGAIFDNTKLMAAHPFLPFNTLVRVKNIENEKTVDVEILDCGPFVKGRVIDLSKEAFSQIGSIGSGLMNIELEILELGPKQWQNKCFELTQRKW
jgi:rare lipoprotein A